MKVTKKFVLYLRLSKPKKGKNKETTKTDAYGIEHQREAGMALVARAGGVVIAEYIEIETGTKKRTRPELARAISHTRLHKATLLIGKMDRLARNIHFVSGLMESGVDFVAADNEHATPLLIHILVSVAEDEARVIAQRTSEGLQVAKGRGVKLGSARPGHWKGREHLRGFKAANKASAVARRENAVAAYSFLIEDIRKWREDGVSLADVAAKLNELGHTTTRNKPFTAVAVMRIVEMFPVTAA